MTDLYRQKFHHPDVRALAWARFSAPLVADLDGKLPSPIDTDLAFLQRLDNQPQALTNHLTNCNSHRLGYYFEELWSFYLQHHPDYQLLAHNEQVKNREKRTLGAFDFIYKYLPDNQIRHLEVAVKFYLFTGNTNSNIENQTLWPGPNPKDNLATKVDRLQSHQLKLSSTKEGMAAIEALGAKTPVEASAALKGYLFYPIGLEPVDINWAPSNHCRGQWLPVSRLVALITRYPSNRWTLLAKREWLGERLGLPAEATYSGKEILALLENSLTHYPVMMARLKSEGGIYNEVERFFVAPNVWPEKSETL